MKSNGEKDQANMNNRFIDIQLVDPRFSDVLAARAATLAELPQQGKTGNDIGLNQYITFYLKSERYGIDIKFVEEIRPLKDITLIPCTPEWVGGAVNIRGSIIPVVDIRKFFGIAESESKDKTKVIVVKQDDLRLGLLADDIGEVLDIIDEKIETQLVALTGIHEEFLKGVTATDLIIIDMANFLNDKRLIIYDEI